MRHQRTTLSPSAEPSRELRAPTDPRLPPLSPRWRCCLYTGRLQIEKAVWTWRRTWWRHRGTGGDSSGTGRPDCLCIICDWRNPNRLRLNPVSLVMDSRGPNMQLRHEQYSHSVSMIPSTKLVFLSVKSGAVQVRKTFRHRKYFLFIYLKRLEQCKM